MPQRARSSRPIHVTDFDSQSGSHTLSPKKAASRPVNIPNWGGSSQGEHTGSTISEYWAFGLNVSAWVTTKSIFR